jgi:hypothetical protein
MLPGMSKRALGALLWFVAVWFGYEVVWSVTGVPRLVGPVIAFAVAAFVTLDPIRAFWQPATDAEPRPGSVEVEQTLA